MTFRQRFARSRWRWLAYPFILAAYYVFVGLVLYPISWGCIALYWLTGGRRA